MAGLYRRPHHLGGHVAAELRQPGRIVERQKTVGRAFGQVGRFPPSDDKHEFRRRIGGLCLLHELLLFTDASSCVPGADRHFSPVIDAKIAAGLINRKAEMHEWLTADV